MDKVHPDKLRQMHPDAARKAAEAKPSHEATEHRKGGKTITITNEGRTISPGPPVSSGGGPEPSKGVHKHIGNLRPTVKAAVGKLKGTDRLNAVKGAIESAKSGLSDGARADKRLARVNKRLAKATPAPAIRPTPGPLPAIRPKNA